MAPRRICCVCFRVCVGLCVAWHWHALWSPKHRIAPRRRTPIFVNKICKFRVARDTVIECQSPGFFSHLVGKKRWAVFGVLRCPGCAVACVARRERSAPRLLCSTARCYFSFGLFFGGTGNSPRTCLAKHPLEALLQIKNGFPCALLHCLQCCLVLLEQYLQPPFLR